MAQKQHFSIRLPQQVLERLEEQAAASGATKTALAERYVAEAVAVARHPGIMMRDGPAGRRAGVIGGPDVWEIIETFQDAGCDVAAAASYLDLPIGLAQAAIGFYADNRAEIDGWIARNAAVAAQAEASWRRRQAVTE